MARRHSVVPLAALIALTCGCASSRFAQEREAAEEQLAAAEDAGVKNGRLELAQESLDFAEEAEDSAEEDLEDAREDLEQARERLEEWESRLAGSEAERDRIAAELAGAREQVEEVQEEEWRLRDRGLSREQVRTAVGPRSPLARSRLEASQAALATLDKQIELSNLAIRDAEMYEKAAKARMESADQRLRVARALYVQAREMARAAEVELVARRQSEANERLRALTPVAK